MNTLVLIISFTLLALSIYGMFSYLMGGDND